MKTLELTDDEVRALFLLAVYGRPRLTGDHEGAADDVVVKVWELTRSLPASGGEK